MSAAYCGAKEVPKGKRRGSMKECANASQIRYYGIKKIDSTTIKSVEKSRRELLDIDAAIHRARKLLMQIKGRIVNYSRKLQAAKTTDEKNEVLDDISELKEKQSLVGRKIKELETTKEEKRKKLKNLK